MKSFTKALALSAAMMLPAAASAAVLNYTIDGAGITFDGATITGGFTWDSVANTYSDIALTVSGAGSRDGSYSILYSSSNVGALGAVRTGSGSDFSGADMAVIGFSAGLGSPGPITITNALLTDCRDADCSGFFVSGLIYEERGDLGTLTGVVVPLPAGLPLLLGGLGLLGVFRTRKSRAA